MDTVRSTFAPYLPLIKVHAYICEVCNEPSTYPMQVVPGFDKPFCHRCVRRVAHELEQDGSAPAPDSPIDRQRQIMMDQTGETDWRAARAAAWAKWEAEHPVGGKR